MSIIKFIKSLFSSKEIDAPMVEVSNELPVAVEKPKRKVKKVEAPEKPKKVVKKTTAEVKPKKPKKVTKK